MFILQFRKADHHSTIPQIILRKCCSCHFTLDWRPKTHMAYALGACLCLCTIYNMNEIPKMQRPVQCYNFFLGKSHLRKVHGNVQNCLWILVKRFHPYLKVSWAQWSTRGLTLVWCFRADLVLTVDRPLKRGQEDPHKIGRSSHLAETRRNSFRLWLSSKTRLEYESSRSTQMGIINWASIQTWMNRRQISNLP